MEFCIKASLKGLKRVQRRELDAQIVAAIGVETCDAKVDGNKVWRNYSGVEILDTPTMKVISGKAKPETVNAIRNVLEVYGCELA